MTKVLVFDDVAGGHHPDFLAGISSAALAQGHELLVGSPEPPPNLQEHQVHHAPVTGFTLRQVLKGRRQLKELEAKCRDDDVRIFLDLFLDKNIWAFTTGHKESKTERIHVLHRIAQYRYEGRTGLARVRTAFLRRHLRRLAVHGDRVIVHTEAAAAVLDEFMPANSFSVVGLPVCTEAELRSRVSIPPAHEDPILLFVGAAREEKGLETLLQAIPRLEVGVVVAIAGGQPPGTRARITERFPQVRIQWSDRYLSRRELDAAYASCSLVVLPYQPSYGHGPASGVLWETLSYGRPLLVSDALAGQLPSAFAAATVSGASASEIADGLRVTLSRLAQLQEAALELGPEIVREHHTYDRYVAALLGSRV